MHELPPEELLSAYLDGEVTADEQAQVERLLAESAEARRLFDELQSLRGQFEQLPRRALPSDFGQSVMRQAERKMLGSGIDERDAVDRDADELGAVQPADDVEELPLSERVRKPMLFGMLAVATALLLSFFNPTAPQREMRRGNVAWREEAAETAPATTSTPALPPIDGFADVASPLAAPSAVDPSAIEFKSAPILPGGAGNPDLDKLAADAPEAKKGATAAGLAGSPSAPPSRASGFGVSSVDASGVGLLIVKCDVSSAVAESGAFQRLLTRRQIDWKQLDDSAEREVLAAGRTEAGDERSAASRKSKSGQQEVAAQDPDLIYIETTPDRLESTLAEMASLNEVYLSVEVAPVADAPLQQRWQTQYARGRSANERQLPALNQLGQKAENSLQPLGVDRRSEPAKAGQAPARPPSAEPTIAGATTAGSGTKPAAAPVATAPSNTPPKPDVPNVPQEKLSDKQGLAAPQDSYRNNQLPIGRARSYSIPADSNSFEQGKSQVAPARTAPKASSPAQASEPVGTMRALFVLQIAPAEEAAVPEPAKP